MRGFGAILRKEGLQMVRDTGTLRFAFMVPVFQLVLFGLIDTNVHRVPTAVFDQSRTAESRTLIQSLTNTSYFEVIQYAASRADLRAAIVARIAWAIASGTLRRSAKRARYNTCMSSAVVVSSASHKLMTTVRAPARRSARRMPNTPSL